MLPAHDLSPMMAPDHPHAPPGTSPGATPSTAPSGAPNSAPNSAPSNALGAALPVAPPPPATFAIGDSGAFPRVTRASVIVGTHETPYLRLGRGAPALYLAPNAERETTSAWDVATALAATRRVTLLEPPPTTPHASPHAAHAARSASLPAFGPAFATWLTGLLDGLGIARAAIIAAEVYALRVLHFALAHGDRVERVVLLTDDAPDSTLPLIGAVGTTPAVPVLILPSLAPTSLTATSHAPDESHVHSRSVLMAFVAGDGEGDATTG